MIELVGSAWGTFGSPPRGTRLNAMPSNEPGIPTGWVFIFNGTQWFAQPGNISHPWSAREIKETSA